MPTAPFQDTAWFKSSYSNGGQDDCVEVNHSLPGHVGVRDSKLGAAGPVLAVPSAQWTSLIAAVKDDLLQA
ncbi:MAG: DUF397 domain-containing protein [Pseudonocardiaceae bacterium]